MKRVKYKGEKRMKQSFVVGPLLMIVLLAESERMDAVNELDRVNVKS